MADQHNDNIPVATNTLPSDVPDIKENLGWHKDVFEVITGNWSNTSTANIVPYREVNTFSAVTSKSISGLASEGIRRVTLILDSTGANYEIVLRFNSDGGSNYTYYGREEFDGTDSNVTTFSGTSRPYILLGGNTTNDAGTYLIEFVFGFSPGNNKNVVVNFKSSFRNVTSNYYGFWHGMGAYSGASAVTSYSISLGGGNTITGTLLHERLA
jgi:hypothetical protein